jgi:hypothetical protein
MKIHVRLVAPVAINPSARRVIREDQFKRAILCRIFPGP